ncbi:uncharacterized protein LOC111125933 isoform X1 [Crassostrea virginica]
MADFAVLLPLLLTLVLVWVPSLVSARTLTFEDDRCGGPYYATARESFQVTHTGGTESFICRDMTFSGWDDEDGVSREVCVKVTEFRLDCSQTLEYRAKNFRGAPTKAYGCEESLGTIPVFCTFEMLRIRIKLDEPLENTRVRYTVYSGAEEEDEDSDFPIFSVIGPLIILLVVVVTIAFVCYKRRRNATQLPSATGRVLYTPGQSQQVNMHHYYHQVGQNQPQEHTYPPQGYSAPPQQSQPYPPQGYSAPPQQLQPYPTQGYSALPQQVQTYTQPSAPTAYPYPPGQEVYPPQTATSAHQHSSDTGAPPSYDEVTKQKK